ncbi:MAG: hypothetical protein ABH869_05640 [Candidatus Omnitrophota bacterium]
MKIRTTLLLSGALAMSWVLAMRIDSYDYSYTVMRPEPDIPVYSRWIGAARSIVSSLSVLQADLYYHGGVGHFFEEHGNNVVNSMLKQVRKPPEHDHADNKEDINEKNKLNRFNFLFRISQETEITEHIHLSGEGLTEIMPWLFYAVQIDPGNIKAYVVTGYFLADVLEKTDEAVELLKQGLRTNYDSWEINAELGRIYFLHRKDKNAAMRFFLRSKDLLGETVHDRFQERYVLTFLAVIYEELKQPRNALPLREKIMELFPEKFPRQQ